MRFELVVTLFFVFQFSVLTKLQTVEDLDPSIVADIITILYNGTVNTVGNCTPNLSATLVSYWIVDASGNLVPLSSFDLINATLPIVYTVHGWGGNKNIPYMKIIWQAYSQYRHFNIIVVDYSAYSAGAYQDAVCNLPVVAQNFANHLCEMSIYLHVDLETVHVVSHSLGSQLTGRTGQKVIQMGCGTIGRITGLDPAGPLFQGSSTAFRLDKSDGLFVDIIHTNQGQYGYTGPVGHIDFYPNCGLVQPGCQNILLNISAILASPTAYISCNHQRSCYLFAESIYRNGFLANSCSLCGTLICLPPLLLESDTTYMGESCTRPTGIQNYYVETESTSPYGKGPVAPQ